MLDLKINICGKIREFEFEFKTACKLENYLVGGLASWGLAELGKNKCAPNCLKWQENWLRSIFGPTPGGGKCWLKN